MSKVVFADPGRCINCRSCEIACEREHGGLSGMFVMVLDEQAAVPVNCSHCSETPCAAICPTGAIRVTEEGAVVVQAPACNGCGFCVVACPFGVIRLDGATKVIQKCDLCIHRLSDGLTPVCVRSCPSRALRFEELETLSDGVRRQAASRLVGALGRSGLVSAAPQCPERR